MSNCPSGKQWQLAGDPPDTLEKIGGVRLPEGVRTVRCKAIRTGRHCMHCRQATYQFPAGTARFRQAVSSDDGK